MTQRDERVPIRHALDAARRIVSCGRGWSRTDLDPDDLSTLGVLRLLEVIGEAANSVSGETRAAHPQVPWRAMIGLRNRLIHGYFDVNLEIVWDTIQRDVPELIPVPQELLAKLDRG